MCEWVKSGIGDSRVRIEEEVGWVVMGDRVIVMIEVRREEWREMGGSVRREVRCEVGCEEVVEDIVVKRIVLNVRRRIVGRWDLI